MPGLQRRSLALAALGGAMAIAAVLILYWGRDQSFFADEWGFIMNRRSWSFETLFYPGNGHLLVLPVVFFKGLLAAFGADSFLPFRLSALAFVLLNAGLLYLVARPRLGPELALAPAVVLLFLGAAWEVIVPGFGLSVLIAIAAGLGMLLCLDRRDLRGDLAACALLAVSLASFSVGVIFGAIGAAEVLQRDGRERLRRAWVFLAPALPYAIWLLWARKYNQPALDASNIGATPAAVADGAAATAAAIFGLSRTPGPEVPGFPDLGTRIEWGIPIATALVAALVLRVRRGPPPTPRAWALILGLLLYWVLLGLSVNEARFPSSSRYLYPAALLVLMLATELAAGLRITRRWRLAIAAVLAVSLFASVDTIRVGGYFFREEADYNRAELGALEISRARVAPEFEIELPGEGTLLPHGDIGQLAFQYFEASEEFGSPAYTEAELAAAGPPQRDAADQLLGRALRLRAEPLRRPPRLPSGTGGRIEPAGLVHHMTVGERRGCLVLRPDLGREGRAALQLPPGGFSYRAPPRAEVDIKLGRFGDGFAVKPGRVLGSAEVRIPTDGSDRPWRALIRPTEPLLACPA